MAACKGHKSLPVPESLQKYFHYESIHTHPETMAAFAKAKAYAHAKSTCAASRLLDLKLPFCHTTWAEQYGAVVNLGEWTNGPRVTRPIPGLTTLPSVEALRQRKQASANSRLPVVLSAIQLLHAEGLKPALVLEGPFTLLTEIAGMETVIRSARKEKEAVHALLAELTSELIAYGFAAIEAGAASISFADPLASHKLLGAGFFNTLILPYHAQVARAFETMKAQGTHITICPVLAADCDCLKHFSSCCTSLDSLSLT